MPPPIETRADVEKLTAFLRDHLKPFVGQEVTPQTQVQVQTAIAEGITPLLKPQAPPDVKVSSLWETWSFWGKVVWVLLAYSLVRRHSYNLYLYGQRLLTRAWLDNRPDFEKNPELEVLWGESYTRTLEIYKGDNFSWWFEPTPHLKLVASFDIKPPLPLQFLQLNLSIREETG